MFSNPYIIHIGIKILIESLIIRDVDLVVPVGQGLALTLISDSPANVDCLVQYSSVRRVGVGYHQIWS